MMCAVHFSEVLRSSYEEAHTKENWIVLVYPVLVIDCNYNINRMHATSFCDSLPCAWVSLTAVVICKLYSVFRVFREVHAVTVQ
jgi:hypothetical protein